MLLDSGTITFERSSGQWVKQQKFAFVKKTTVLLHGRRREQNRRGRHRAIDRRRRGIQPRERRAVGQRHDKTAAIFKGFKERADHFYETYKQISSRFSETDTKKKQISATNTSTTNSSASSTNQSTPQRLGAAAVPPIPTTPLVHPTILDANMSLTLRSANERRQNGLVLDKLDHIIELFAACEHQIDLVKQEVRSTNARITKIEENVQHLSQEKERQTSSQERQINEKKGVGLRKAFDDVVPRQQRNRSNKVPMYGPKKPADILVYDMEDGKNLALDVSITCPVQKKYAKKVHHQQFEAATYMFGIKHDKYEDTLDPSRVVFRPFIFESFGGIPKESQTILKNLAMDLRHIMRLEFNDIYCHLKRKACVLIWRTNWENARDRISWELQYDEDDGDDDDII